MSFSGGHLASPCVEPLPFAGPFGGGLLFFARRLATQRSVEFAIEIAGKPAAPIGAELFRTAFRRRISGGCELISLDWRLAAFRSGGALRRPAAELLALRPPPAATPARGRKTCCSARARLPAQAAAATEGHRHRRRDELTAEPANIITAN